MKKIVFIITFFFSIISINTYSQGSIGFHSSNHVISSDSNNLRIIQTVVFSISHGMHYPSSVRYNQQTIQNPLTADTLKIDFFYDRRGAFPYSYSTAIDTLDVGLQSGEYCIVIDSYSIFHDIFSTNSADSIITKLATDTSCNITLSISEETPLNELKIYPNPVKDFLQLEFETNERKVEIEILAQTGQVIRRFSYQKGDLIDVSDLQKGMYFIKFINTENPTVSAFAKQ